MRDRGSPQELKRIVERDRLVMRMVRSEKIEISDQVLAYFRNNPEAIDEVTASTRVHLFFLWVGMGIGLLAVAFSTLLAQLPLEDYLNPGFASFLIDVIFEGGVALIGAALTAYFMGILLNTQQERALAFRREIRRRLEDT